MSEVFKKPVNTAVGSKFGPRVAPVAGASTNHNGVDFPAAVGTAITAPISGKITAIYEDKTYGSGNVVLMEHPGKWKSGYAHLSTYGTFKVGDQVKQGEVIGYVGKTGRVSGPHLHFTLTDPKGKKVDPELYFGKSLIALG